MTEQEQQLINGLAEQIRNAPAPQIDRDANNLIQRTIGSRPDALYILTQTVLVQQMALDQAKAQIDDLKRQSDAQPQPGFLPGSPQAGNQGGYQAGGYRGSSYQNSSYAAPPPPQEAPPPPPPPPQSGGGFSGFLHNVATTAAGVIAGDLAFDAISSLFGGHRGYGGGGFLGGGGGETIVNNYYEDDRRDRNDDRDDSRFAQAADQNQDQDISPDIDDERDNSGDSFDDDSSFDDSSN
jgi:uncharacterized protein